jgi:hypothetical protein
MRIEKHHKEGLQSNGHGHLLGYYLNNYLEVADCHPNLETGETNSEVRTIQRGQNT